MCNSKNNDPAMPYILVVTENPFFSGQEPPKILITTLVFRNGADMRHPVNTANLEMFLTQAKLFGATIFSNAPQAGCYAVEGDQMVEDGELAVCEIYFEGNLIYKHCNSLL